MGNCGLGPSLCFLPWGSPGEVLGVPLWQVVPAHCPPQDLFPVCHDCLEGVREHPSLGSLVLASPGGCEESACSRSLPGSRG